MSAPRRKIAILFRYGAGEHVDFLPALPALARQLTRAGHEVHHFGFKGEVTPPPDLCADLKIHEGPFRVRRSSGTDKTLKALLWLLLLPLLGWRCRRQGFDAVFVDETLPLSAPLLRLTYPGTLLFTVHDFFLEIYWEPRPLLRYPGRLIQAVDLSAWRRLTHIFTRVEAAGRHLAGKGVEPARISAVPDPVDLRLFRPSTDDTVRERWRRSAGVEPEDFLMVHHGIMHPNKGNLLLVQAVADLRETLPRLKLLLIGDGPEMKTLRDAVKALHLEDRVILTGWLPGMREIAEALQASDLGLVMRRGLPGDHFHVTSTLVHNLACGLPVLAARLEGVSEVLADSGAGEMFDPACGDEFREKLISLARDPERRETMGKRARKLAESRFDPEQVAAAYAKWICP